MTWVNANTKFCTKCNYVLTLETDCLLDDRHYCEKCYTATRDERAATKKDDGRVREFATGATRSTAAGKYEYARFMDPRVIKEFAAYMHRHRVQPDGTLRDPDNWKKGIPISAFMDSIGRHYQDLWELHEYGSAVRPEDGAQVELRETLCALMFNVMGWLHEDLKAERAKAQSKAIPGEMAGLKGLAAREAA